MNSELVFSAQKMVPNRYLLCRLTARTARVLHFASSHTRDAITDAFVRLGEPKSANEWIRSPEIDKGWSAPVRPLHSDS